MPPRPALVARLSMVVALASVATTPADGGSLDDAVALHQAGQLDAALAAYREIAATSASEAERAAAHNNACVLLHDRGDFLPAGPECAEAVRLRRKPGSERSLAQSLNNWALALQAAGERDAARLRMDEALQLNRRLDEREEAVVNLANLAAFEIENGRYGDALDRVVAAERLVDAAGDADWAAEQSRVLRLNRAVALERLGAWRESLALLSGLATEPEPDESHAAALAVDLAVVYRNLGDPRTAVRLLEGAIAAFQRLGDRAALANARLNLGLAAELNLNDPVRAAREYEEVLALARAGGDEIGQVQALVGLARLAAERGDTGRAAIVAGEAVELSSRVDDPEARWAALDAAARAARAGGREDEALDRLLAAIAIVEGVRAGGGSAAARAGFLTDKRGLFAAAVDLAARKASKSGVRREILAALAIVERAKARELLDFAPGSPRPLGVEGLSALANGELGVIEYFFGEATLWRFELSGSVLRLADLGPAHELADLAAEAHAALARGAESSAFERLGLRLLEGLALDRHELAIAPDGRLRYLPFDAFRDSNGARLLDRALTYLIPSASFLSAHATPPAPTSTSYVGLAPTPGAFDPRSRAGVLAARFELGPLPESAQEIAAFAARLPSPAVALSGPGATIPALTAALGSGARVVHFAAHTLLDEQLAGDGAAIFLAPGGEGDDGLLAPRAIAALPLDGALVLLSGCSTALGSTTDGEALTTLVGSILAAGASGVVASLWEVGDRASAALMEQLAFELARGARPAAALRTAKLRLSAAPGGENPAVWAAFVLIGDAPPPFPVRRLRVEVWATALAALLFAALAAVSYRRSGSSISSTGSESATRAPAASSAETSTR